MSNNDLTNLDMEDNDFLSWLLFSADALDLDLIDDTDSKCADTSMFQWGDKEFKNIAVNSDDLNMLANSSDSSVAPGTRSNRDQNTANENESKLGKKRNRTKDYLLENRLEELQTENRELQEHLKNVTQRTTETHKQRAEMERLMIKKLHEGDQAGLEAIVATYKDLYADYGACRQKEVQYHLQQLEKLVVPTQTTKMCLYTLQQDKNFFQSKQSPLFAILSQEINITEEQWAKIHTRREHIHALLHQLKESLDLIQELKSDIVAKHHAFDSQCGRIQDAASPRQSVLFLLWIAKNSEKLAKIFPEYGASKSSASLANMVSSPPSNGVNNLVKQEKADIDDDEDDEDGEESA